MHSYHPRSEESLDTSNLSPRSPIIDDDDDDDFVVQNQRSYSSAAAGAATAPSPPPPQPLPAATTAGTTAHSSSAAPSSVIIDDDPLPAAPTAAAAGNNAAASSATSSSARPSPSPREPVPPMASASPSSSAFQSAATTPIPTSKSPRKNARANMSTATPTKSATNTPRQSAAAAATTTTTTPLHQTGSSPATATTTTNRRSHPIDPDVERSETEVARATADLERLLVDKIADSHAKEDEIFSLRRVARELQQDLEERSSFVLKLKEELAVLQESVRIERNVREATERDMEKCVAEHAPDAEEVAAIHKELECFRATTGGSVSSSTMSNANSNSPSKATRGGGGGGGGGYNPKPKLAREVGGLARALMALQLDLIRAFSWAGNSMIEQWTYTAKNIHKDEEDVRLQLVISFESELRTCIHYTEEVRQRHKLSQRYYHIQQRLVASMSMLGAHERTASKSILDLSVKNVGEWSTLGALYAESLRKSHALKLRQANALVKKARDETEEKVKLLEEAKRQVVLVKARSDATRRERAAAAATGHHQQNNSNNTSLPSRSKQHRGGALQSHDHSTAVVDVSPSTASYHRNAEEDEEDLLFLMAASPRSAADAHDHENSQQNDSTIVTSPLPPRGTPTRRRSNMPSNTLVLAEKLETSERALAAAKSRHESDVSRVSHLQSEIISLRQHVSKLESLMKSKDAVIVKVKEERNALDAECDSVAAQCRLLEQACKFGAKKALELQLSSKRL